MKLKRCALSLLLARLGMAILLLAAGCSSNLRKPMRGTNSLTGVIEAEIQCDHWYYDFGESVHIQARLKNVSRKDLVFGNETVPVMDIRIQSSPTDAHYWAQEHSDDVKRLVTLKPGESYTVEWTMTPTSQAIYGIDAWWTDSEGDRSGMGTTIFYGVRPPGPLP